MTWYVVTTVYQVCYQKPPLRLEKVRCTIFVSEVANWYHIYIATVHGDIKGIYYGIRSILIPYNALVT